VVKIETMGKSWFISELTSTNNSHSICGFSQLWRMCLQSLKMEQQPEQKRQGACLYVVFTWRETSPNIRPQKSVPTRPLASAAFLSEYLPLVRTVYKDCTLVCVEPCGMKGAVPVRILASVKFCAAILSWIGLRQDTNCTKAGHSLCVCVCVCTFGSVCVLVSLQKPQATEKNNSIS
jgi:hypothetical protein